MKFNGMLILVAVFLAAGCALAHAQSHQTPVGTGQCISG